MQSVARLPRRYRLIGKTDPGNRSFIAVSSFCSKMEQTYFHIDNVSGMSFLAADSTSVQSSGAAPQTYIVAQNPLVLAHLLRENQARSLDPQAYTTPASVSLFYYFRRY